MANIVEKYKIFIVIALILCTSVLVSYGAFFTIKNQTGDNKITSGCFSTSFTDGTSINLTNALPLSDEDGQKTTPYTFTLTNTCSVDAKYYVIMNFIGDYNDISYLKISVNGNTPQNVSLLDYNYDFEKPDNTYDSHIIKTGTLKAGASTTENIRLWLDENTTYDEVEGASWEAEIMVINQAHTSTVVDKIIASSNGVAPTSLFASVATTDEGIFEMEDDYGTSYYFRGNVSNNYVLFAGFCWRIIRINGDGSLRIIYDGTSCHANTDTSTDRYLFTSAFNSSDSDMKDVGYMYGLAGTITDANRCLMLDSSNNVVDNISTYTTKSACENAGGKWTTTFTEANYANIKNSDIKNVIDEWYLTNIYNNGLNKYISDTLFCGDRTGEVLPYQTGSLSYTVTHNATQRLVNNKIPQLKCPDKNDAFTVSDTYHGNGELIYPIGLITADEINLAGSMASNDNEIYNQNYYLYRGNYYWTMTPNEFAEGTYASVFYITENGDIGSALTFAPLGVAPVISLNSEAISKLIGSGIIGDEYRLSA